MQTTDSPHRRAKSLTSAFLLFVFAATAYASNFVVGDVIAIDFSITQGRAPNYNIIDAATLAIGAGDVIRWNDGSLIDGVSITFTGATAFTKENGANNWPGQANDPYYNVGTSVEDFVYASNTGAPLVLTFSGLDTTLKYEVRIYSLDGTERKAERTEHFMVTDGDSFQSVICSRGERWDAATLEEGGTVFSGIMADANGEIVVAVEGISNDNPFMNAIVLVAVPEAAAGAWVLALCALAAGVRRRRG